MFFYKCTKKYLALWNLLGFLWVIFIKRFFFFWVVILFLLYILTHTRYIEDKQGSRVYKTGWIKTLFCFFTAKPWVIPLQACLSYLHLTVLHVWVRATFNDLCPTPTLFTLASFLPGLTHSHFLLPFTWVSLEPGSNSWCYLKQGNSFLLTFYRLRWD